VGENGHATSSQTVVPGSEPNEDPQLDDEEPPELVPGDEEESDDEAEDSDDKEDDGICVRRSARIAAGVWQPPHYTLVTQLKPGSHNYAIRNEGIQKAEIEEVLMCFVTLGALLPVLKSELEGAVALSCHMFTIKKFLANGEQDKFKSRIVAHGNEQDTLLYPDRSSPMVSMQAIMACLAIAAYNRNFRIAKINVKVAFIQMEMKGRPVFIRCNKKLTQLIVDVILWRYVCKDETVYCCLLKALCGCVQASKLWYEKLSSFLKSLGYERCPVEPCVMRRIENGVVYTLLIYVDDILVIGDDKEFERLRAAFTKEFRWITMEVSNVLLYLGMHIVLHVLS
jgi:hypothetical protein